ncbi:PREDICTED: sphingosine-1-phosphate phosphatase 2-like [Vollenhovia emeryi]|uniref:sphingosine-1-phosphate phosphatase 2-like n=1 Tax=Vollenhovia emeryi TaxID=411798 RepID=UPI0005F3E5EF|nr:PREDICTED: sphingosine-1-phosphate phosphatase 2-like [Vollenhovia emeryi]XP_011864341.1 PREDICTED: sphingosine-1-phosphate phosphatase 2-like [Vollenhovia emeryi]XP_011864342.1 PREDICTED: sphingosine-1-phosphate phosphatase 2-like [Vollenhovia emeryi]XP_011864343.1 PREDICTED: sphingosine-1-phosphate phosphatase 2-like [Vollenhovia emeryi]
MGIMDYLRDPHLVALIQRFFGVRIHYDKDNKTFQEEEKKYIYTEIDDNEENYISTCHSRKLNGCDINSKQSNTSPLKHGTNVPTMKQTALTEASDNPTYTIDNFFWYYTFVFGTELGDEIFYSTFIPFLFWNIDGAIGQKVILVWAIIMTIGQILKDVICWPRPACPPAVRLQNKWSQEYGMPSTHAMVGLTIPFSVVLFTMNKYIYPFSVGCSIAFLWCLLVSMSRLYLGMHTVLDIVAGLVLAILLMILLVPVVSVTNFYVVTNFWLLAMLIAISIATIVYYPSSNKWTPTRSDTAMVVSVAAGVHAGAWLNYCTGLLRASQSLPPFHIVWPTYSMFGCLIIRTVLGFSGVAATKVLSKSVSYIVLCGILRINWRELMKCQDYGNPNKVFVDLVYKYISCFMIGVNTVYVLPQVFSVIGIERPAFYTEI